MRRNNCSLSNPECVRGDILSVAAVLRNLGYKTLSALDRIARHVGVSRRRTRTIVFEDQTYTVTDEQRGHFAFRIADLHDMLADEFEERARACRFAADGIRCRERQQQTVPLGDIGAWRTSGRAQQRLCA